MYNQTGFCGKKNIEKRQRKNYVQMGPILQQIILFSNSFYPSLEILYTISIYNSVSRLVLSMSLNAKLLMAAFFSFPFNYHGQIITAASFYVVQQSSDESNFCIDEYDEVGIGGGASGMSGGLLHPYSPKGACERFYQEETTHWTSEFFHQISSFYLSLSIHLNIKNLF